MPPALRTLVTCGLSAGLGVAVGAWYEANPAASSGDRAKAAVAVSAPVAEAGPDKPPAFTDTAAALEWAGRQIASGNGQAVQSLFLLEAGLTEEQRRWLIQVLVKNCNRMDPRVLAHIVLSLPRGEVADRAWNELMARWCADDAEDLLLFLETVPADRLNNIALTNAAFGLARLPAGRLARFAEGLNDEGRAFLAEGLTLFATQTGSWRNTAEVLSKMDVQPHNHAISVEWNLGVNLGTIARGEIEALIEAEADNDSRQRLLAGYAWIQGIRDPERGVRLDALIAQPLVREEHLRRHVSEWLETGREAALAWLRSDDARDVMDDAQRTGFLKIYGTQNR